MPGLAGRLGFLLRSLSDFLFPPICLGCETEIDSGLVCDDCRTQLATYRLGICPECGRPLTSSKLRCVRCRLPFCLTRVRALGPYMPPYSLLVRAMKYDHKTVLARVLGEMLVGLVESDPELHGTDCLCPVPLHRARLRERGYNQAALLAVEVAAGTGLPLISPLVRVRNTLTQTALSDDRVRTRNLRGAFRVKAGTDLEGKRVVLVDDVTTSGATLDAAGRQLLAAGASAVLGLVVAAA